MPVRASLLAVKAAEGVRIVPIGNEQAIHDALEQKKRDPALFDIVGSRDDIGMNDNAAKSLAVKPKAASRCQTLKQGEAFASTGNTGAMLVGSVMVMKPMPGAPPLVSRIYQRPTGVSD